MRIKYHVSAARGFLCGAICSFGMYVCPQSHLQAEDRPVPRKPFVSKSGTNSVAPKPFTSSNSKAPPPTPSSQPLKTSGGAEILTITRSHKPYTPRVIAPEQGQSPAVPPQATYPSTGTGTDSTTQIGRIIEK